MIQKIKSLSVTLATLLLAVTPVALAVPAYAAGNTNIAGAACQGTNFNITDQTSGDVSACNDNNGGTGTLNTLLTKVINIFSAIVGVIAVLMIIVGGLRYITSGGDSGKVGAAKTTIIYALVGLVIVALSQLIVHFVLVQATSVING